MNRRLLILLVLLSAWGMAGPSAPARAQAQPYTIDILSSEYYPQLRDSWMFFINNQGVAAGYVATESSQGPFLPATYTGGGRFQTYGIESRSYYYSVTGIDDRGFMVGNVTNQDGSQTPYIARNGVAEFPILPGEFPLLDGISNAGTIYASTVYSDTNAIGVFTLRDGIVNRLPISAPGITHFFSETGRGLSNAGLLSLSGYSDNFSVFHNYLYDIPTGRLAQVAAPAGYDRTTIRQVTGSGLVFGRAYLADGSGSRYGFWNADGSFRSFFDAPAGTFNVQINNFGQAIGLNAGRPLFFDGASWSEREVLGLNGYTLAGINDFNDRGQFVGLAFNPQQSFLWGYVATPQQPAIPEPSSAVLLALGLIGPLGGAVLRRQRARRNKSANR